MRELIPKISKRHESYSAQITERSETCPVRIFIYQHYYKPQHGELFCAFRLVAHCFLYTVPAIAFSGFYMSAVLAMEKHGFPYGAGVPTVHQLLHLNADNRKDAKLSFHFLQMYPGLFNAVLVHASSSTKIQAKHFATVGTKQVYQKLDPMTRRLASLLDAAPELKDETFSVINSLLAKAEEAAKQHASLNVSYLYNFHNGSLWRLLYVCDAGGKLHNATIDVFA